MYMKITPLEIRQKSFEKNFRGYDKDEVSSFLVSLSQEWEKEMDEKRELKIKLDQVEKESAKLREVEDSLFKTLKAAEDTGASMIEQANKTAELILKEAQMNADAMISEAKSKARNIIDEADGRAKNIVEDLKAEVNSLVESYEDLLAQREIVVRNLKNLATDSLENVKQSQEDIKRINLEVHTKAVKELSRQMPNFKSEEEKAVSMPREKSHTFVIETKKEESPAPIEALEQHEEVNAVENEPVTESQEPTNEEEQDTSSNEVQVKDEVPNEADETSKYKESILPEKKEEKPEITENKKTSGSFFDQFD
ncbi:DivIVA domain-containing protein [Echinicola marina]|uniref:DivIVA domain-containing protein n=1 Tax=Echinicola marina TaxID=2859768 RepID=UPI001CF609E0|nr:DivIVA domain-containing protein [Echinicola marina]